MRHAGTTSYKIEIGIVIRALNQTPYLISEIPEHFTDIDVEDGCIVFREPRETTLERARQ